MESQNITDMMIQEARKEAEQIIKNAQELAGSILERQKQLGIDEARAKASLLLKKAATEAATERLRKLTDAETTSNWIVLSRKEKIIDGILKEAKNKLRTLVKTNEYQSILEKLIIEASVALEGKELEVLLNEKDSSLRIDFGELSQEIGKRTGFETALTLSAERIEAIGGSIVKKSDGKVVMDNTFDDIIRRQEKDLRAKIANTLFK